MVIKNGPTKRASLEDLKVRKECVVLSAYLILQLIIDLNILFEKFTTLNIFYQLSNISFIKNCNLIRYFQDNN